MQSVILTHNGSQFLNITPLFISSTRFAASSAPAPVIVVVPLTKDSFSVYSFAIYLPLCIYLPSPIFCSSFVTKPFFGKIFRTFVILSAILLTIKSPFELLFLKQF